MAVTAVSVQDNTASLACNDWEKVHKPQAQ